MFKRVEKRRRKREEEEELGLDEDMKEVLGMQDTDSEESASDSDDLSASAEGSNDERVASGKGTFKEDADLDHVEDDSEPEDEQPVITVQEALRDPLYLVSLEPVMKACIVCPGKHLKGAKMVELHQTSNAHERRVKLFKALASRAKPQDNAWDLLREYAEKKSPPSLVAPSENSKRAQKRKAHSALRKARRDKQKAKAKAKKTAAAKPSSSEPRTTSPPPVKPPKKKPKITTPPPAPGSPTQTPRETASVSIASITRSASDRAKMARTRAGNDKAKRGSKVATS